MILGKTNLPELAIYGFTESPTWGDTRNPWDPSRTCGGSSGGSGVAVAAGLCAIAHATDGAGSIRYPAAYCGLFGLKPQRNRVSLSPDREHWHGLSVSGCVSRTVMDTALYLDAMSGPEKGDFDSPPPFERPLVEAARTPPGKLRIACTTKTILPVPKATEVIDAYEETIELLRSPRPRGDARRRPTYGPPRHATSIPSTSAASATRRCRCLTRSGSRTRPRGSSGSAGCSAIAGSPRCGTGCRRHRAGSRSCGRTSTCCSPRRPPSSLWRSGAGGARARCGRSTGCRTSIPTRAAWNYTGQPAAAVPAGLHRHGPAALGDAGRAGRTTRRR